MKPGFHHVKGVRKSEPKAEAWFYLNKGNNHSLNCCKIWPYVVFPQGYLGAPEKTVCEGIAFAEEESSSPPPSPS